MSLKPLSRHPELAIIYFLAKCFIIDTISLPDFIPHTQHIAHFPLFSSQIKNAWIPAHKELLREQDFLTFATSSRITTSALLNLLSIRSKRRKSSQKYGTRKYLSQILSVLKSLVLRQLNSKNILFIYFILRESANILASK